MLDGFYYARVKSSQDKVIVYFVAGKCKIVERYLNLWFYTPNWYDEAAFEGFELWRKV